MRRTALALAVTLVAAPMAEGTFGIPKTRVTLFRPRPPQIPIASPEVFVDVVTGPVVLPVTSGMRGDVETGWQRVREGVSSTKLYRLVDAPSEGASTVTVVLSAPSTGVRYVRGGTTHTGSASYARWGDGGFGTYFETSSETYT